MSEIFHFFLFNLLAVDAGGEDVHPICFLSKKMTNESQNSWLPYYMCKDPSLGF